MKLGVGPSPSEKAGSKERARRQPLCRLPTTSDAAAGFRSRANPAGFTTAAAVANASRTALPLTLQPSAGPAAEAPRARHGARRRNRPPISSPQRVLLALALALRCTRRWPGSLDFVCDDACICSATPSTWRRARGLTFNLGQRPPVEGPPNFLWVLLARCSSASAGRRRGRESLQRLARRRSRSCSGSRAARSPSRSWARSHRPPSLATLPPFAMWTTSGLETMATAPHSPSAGSDCSVIRSGREESPRTRLPRPRPCAPTAPSSRGSCSRAARSPGSSAADRCASSAPARSRPPSSWQASPRTWRGAGRTTETGCREHRAWKAGSRSSLPRPRLALSRSVPARRSVRRAAARASVRRLPRSSARFWALAAVPTLASCAYAVCGRRFHRRSGASSSRACRSSRCSFAWLWSTSETERPGSEARDAHRARNLSAPLGARLLRLGSVPGVRPPQPVPLPARSRSGLGGRALGRMNQNEKRWLYAGTRLPPHQARRVHDHRRIGAISYGTKSHLRHVRHRHLPRSSANGVDPVPTRVPARHGGERASSSRRPTAPSTTSLTLPGRRWSACPRCTAGRSSGGKSGSRNTGRRTPGRSSSTPSNTCWPRSSASRRVACSCSASTGRQR